MNRRTAGESMELPNQGVAAIFNTCKEFSH
jgi:hypothetical protein